MDVRTAAELARAMAQGLASYMSTLLPLPPSGQEVRQQEQRVCIHRS